MTDKVDCVVLDMARYNELLEAEEFLNALRAAGVDNWDGYEYAQDMVSEDEENTYE